MSQSKYKPYYIASAAFIGGGLITYLALQKNDSGSSSSDWPQLPRRPN